MWLFFKNVIVFQDNLTASEEALFNEGLREFYYDGLSDGSEDLELKDLEDELAAIENNKVSGQDDGSGDRTNQSNAVATLCKFDYFVILSFYVIFIKNIP